MNSVRKRKIIQIDFLCPEAGDLLPDEIRPPVRPRRPPKLGEQGPDLCDGEGGEPEGNSGEKERGR